MQGASCVGRRSLGSGGGELIESLDGRARFGAEDSSLSGITLRGARGRLTLAITTTLERPCERLWRTIPSSVVRFNVSGLLAPLIGDGDDGFLAGASNSAWEGLTLSS